ncbi:MAG: TIGR02266 family protein [Polyangiaceae bacterium]
MIQVNKADAAGSRREERLEAEFSTVADAHPDSSREVSPGSQRREHPRYKVELDVSLGSDHNFYVGFVENLSSGGVFIATHMLKAVGEVFELTIHLPNSATAVKGVGEVRWIREYSERSNVPPGMGIRFIQLESDAKALIEEFLSRREPMFFDED